MFVINFQFCYFLEGAGFALLSTFIFIVAFNRWGREREGGGRMRAVERKWINVVWKKRIMRRDKNDTKKSEHRNE